MRLHAQLAGGKSRPVLAALIRIGWREKRQSGSHVDFARPGSPACVFAFHNREELGPHMLAKIPKAAGLKPDE